jgi:hypothetical protein
LTVETFRRRYVIDVIRGILSILRVVEKKSPFKNRVKITPSPQKAGFDATRIIFISHLCSTGFLHSIHELMVPQIPELQALLVVIRDLAT